MLEVATNRPDGESGIIGLRLIVTILPTKYSTQCDGQVLQINRSFIIIYIHFLLEGEWSE